ncbi:MAG: DUF3383 family protein [Oscillospiraceae bacterium]|nr:DUF3383 family protein [Oscillospiraceae bacterium]
MSDNLEMLARVDILLNTPISNNANFGNNLIIGPAPKGGAATDIPLIGVYNKLEDVTALGYKATGDGADPVGVAARVAFSQSPKPREVYIAVTGSEVIDENTGEAVQLSVIDVLENALSMNGWYAIQSVGLSRDEVREIIEWTETQNKIHGYIETDPDNPIVEPNKYYRSYAVYPCTEEKQLDNDIPLENKYGMPIAMAAKAMNSHAGGETWANNPLAAVSPSKLSATFIKKLEKNNISWVCAIASKNITLGGKTNGGEWIDVIRFRDWLQNDMQVRIVNLLVVNPKIPYTDKGIGLVENQMLASLKDGQKYGGIADSEFDEYGAEIKGYVTSVPLAASIPSTAKNSRTLSDCKFSARLAGAIHLVEISGELTYENI